VLSNHGSLDSQLLKELKDLLLVLFFLANELLLFLDCLDLFNNLLALLSMSDSYIRV
jgi:hypothetical protein